MSMKARYNIRVHVNVLNCVEQFTIYDNTDDCWLIGPLPAISEEPTPLNPVSPQTVIRFIGTMHPVVLNSDCEVHYVNTF